MPPPNLKVIDAGSFGNVKRPNRCIECGIIGWPTDLYVEVDGELFCVQCIRGFVRKALYDRKEKEDGK